LAAASRASSHLGTYPSHCHTAKAAMTTRSIASVVQRRQSTSTLSHHADGIQAASQRGRRPSRNLTFQGTFPLPRGQKPRQRADFAHPFRLPRHISATSITLPGSTRNASSNAAGRCRCASWRFYRP
jgi:hypothetical protein